MTFQNWTGWKTVKMILFLLTGLVPIVPAQYQTLASEVLAALGTIVVTLSGTNLGPTVVKPKMVAT
jgi:hypothetical protein